MKNLLTYLLVAICLVLILLPPKWDPAIRSKEKRERERMARERHRGRP